MLAEYWAEKFEKDLMRQLLGQPSEYAQNLRAAKVEPPSEPAQWPRPSITTTGLT